MSTLKLRAVGGTAKQRQYCRDLVRFALPYLLKQNKIDQISIRIVITNHLSVNEDCYGVCYPMDIEGRGTPKRFSIHVDGSLLKRHLLTTLAHELVHCKQWVMGELGAKVSKTKKDDYDYTWLGLPVDDNMNYWLHPWEIEAAGWERNLVELWIEHNGWKNQKWTKEEYFHGEKYWRKHKQRA